MSGRYEALSRALRSGEPAALATVLEGGPVGATIVVRPGAEVLGALGDPELTRVVARDALAALGAGRGGLRHYGLRGEARQGAVTVFLEAFAPPPRMVIFGAVDFTGSLARVAAGLGYRVVVCDARAAFATARRFPQANEVVVEWPERYLARVGDALGPGDAVCVLTHDPKFDLPAIVAALRTEVGYLGAMGSRRTHGRRLEALRAMGVSEADLARVMAPIGLDIGARTPEETAIAIAAEIIACASGRPAPRLRDREGPIH